LRNSVILNQRQDQCLVTAYGRLSLRANQRIQARAPNIGIIDGPFEYLTVAGVRLPLPFTTRMTVVRLTNGDLFLHSPIKFDNRLANELQGLGTPRHLVSPNQFHYAHIGEWAEAFPGAIVWASPRVRERARARHVDIEFTRDLGAIPPEEWQREIDQTLFPGGYFKEFIFFHKASKTLILTDTIINIELDKLTEPWRTATKLTGCIIPTVRFSLACGCPYSFNDGRRRQHSEKSTHGSRSVFCSAMADVSMHMPTKSSGGSSESPTASSLLASGLLSLPRTVRGYARTSAYHPSATFGQAPRMAASGQNAKNSH
jgi:hypothetical protein